jgi:hypothetical protein
MSVEWVAGSPWNDRPDGLGIHNAFKEKKHFLDVQSPLTKMDEFF